METEYISDKNTQVGRSIVLVSGLLFLQDSDGTVRVHRDEAGRLQLLDHLVGGVVVSAEIVDLGNLGFESIESGELGLDIGLILGLLHLRIQDLLLRAPSHVTLLEHINTTPFHDYHKKKN